MKAQELRRILAIFAFMGFLVYYIRNVVNQKLYFGITKCSLQKRWNEHKHRSKSSNSHLYLAIRKYGIAAFEMILIKECISEDEMYETEISLIKENRSNNPKYGYNNSIGGEVSSKGKTLTIEHRKKISVAQKGRKRKPFSDDVKSKMSKSAIIGNRHLSLVKSYGHNKGKPAHNKRKIILNGCEIFDSITDASEKHNISKSSIANNLSRLSKSTKIGIWTYAS